MSNPSPPRAPTSLLLILLTLLTGIALGWLLREVTLAGTGDRGQGTGDRGQGTGGGSQESGVATAAPTLALAAVTQVATIPAPTTAPVTAPLTASPLPTVPPMPPPAPRSLTPAPQPVTGYIGHTVAAGETLQSIAAQRGSAPELIARYNMLAGEPQPGRALIVPLTTAAPTAASEPLLVRRGPSVQPWVALTLDAGAGSAPVAQMLATLRARGVKLTFFLTGKWIKENPELTRQIVADGHEIANHTFSHPDLTRVGNEALLKELANTEALLHATTGATSRPFFRPPYGAYDERVLQTAERAGYLPVYWTLDSLDSIGEPKTPAFLLDRVTGALPPDKLRGAIILAHCGSQPTADALPGILDRFKAMGFEVRKLSEVLGG